MWTELSTCIGLRLKQVIKKLSTEFSVSLTIIFEKSRKAKKIAKLEKLPAETPGEGEKLGYGPGNHPTKI